MEQGNRIKAFLYPGIYREGKDEAAPRRGPRLFFFLWGNYFWKLIGLNLLTLLLCVPLVTIPASLSALSRVLMKLAMQGYCLVFSEYFGEWKAALFRYLPFFALTLLPAAGGAWMVYVRLDTLTGWGGFAVVALCAIVFLLTYLLWCYAFPLFAIIDLPAGKSVRDALYFVATQPRANARLLLVLAAQALFLLFLPWTAPAFLLFLVSVPALGVCCIVQPLIEEHVIRPYHQPAESSASNSSGWGV